MHIHCDSTQTNQVSSVGKQLFQKPITVIVMLFHKFIKILI